MGRHPRPNGWKHNSLTLRKDYKLESRSKPLIACLVIASHPKNSLYILVPLCFFFSLYIYFLLLKKIELEIASLGS